MELSQLKDKLSEITEWLRKEFQTIRTGMASPAILDGVMVESYGAIMPLNQTASISVEGPKSLLISAYDKSTIKAIEKAIVDSDLGVSVVGTDTGVRVSFPDLTAERRVMLAKLAKQKLEDAKVSVRKERDSARQEVARAEKEKEISEDEKRAREKQIDETIQAHTKDLEGMLKAKEEEITL